MLCTLAAVTCYASAAAIVASFIQAAHVARTTDDGGSADPAWAGAENALNAQNDICDPAWTVR